MGQKRKFKVLRSFTLKGVAVKPGQIVEGVLSDFRNLISKGYLVLDIDATAKTADAEEAKAKKAAKAKAKKAAKAKAKKVEKAAAEKEAAEKDEPEKKEEENQNDEK